MEAKIQSEAWLESPSPWLASLLACPGSAPPPLPRLWTPGQLGQYDGEMDDNLQSQALPGSAPPLLPLLLTPGQLAKYDDEIDKTY